MKRRIVKLFTAILLMIVAIAGFMPSIGREVHAETTKQIVFDEDTINNITIIFDSQTFSKDGITLSCYYDAAIVFDDGTGPTVSFAGQELYILHGSFTFSSSIGKISKIEIKCGLAQRLPSGWSFNGDDLTWQGEPSYSVTMENEAERQNEETIVTNISEITFTIITEDVSGISLSDPSLEMKPGDTKSLTATLSPSTATEKEVKWSSSNSSVAKVSDSGVVTAVAEGETVIVAIATNGTQATSDDKSATCKVTVKNPEPEVTNYPLWIGGKKVTSEYLKNEKEGWSFEGDASKGTLKLSGASITGTLAMYGACIFLNNKDYSLTIELSGTNNVNVGKEAYNGIHVFGSLKITGNGKLIVEGKAVGITASQFEIDKTEIDASGESHGLYAETIGISDSTLTATGNFGIMSLGDMKITDSTVTANGSSIGILLNNNNANLSISGKSTVNAKTTNDDGQAIQADVITLKEVEITKPEDGRVDTWDNGAVERKTIYDKEGKIARDITIEPVNPSYSIVSGGNSTYTLGSNQDLVITVKRSINDSLCFDNFKSVEIDGTALTKDEDYTVKAGSTVVTIKAAALEKLSEGSHTVSVSFTDGKVETSLTVKKAEEPTPQPDPKPVTPFPVPNTGIEAPGYDTSLRYIALLGICVFVTSFFNKKH